jgi:predicted NUDIX family NTP pyrophosphohydrolase
MPTSRVGAGLLMYRLRNGVLKVLLVHPVGPFFKNKDERAWSIPKGEVATEEEVLACAVREFTEEIGVIPTGPFIRLTQVEQKGGKTVQAWAFEGNCDPAAVINNTFTIEWPPRSGRQAEFPEIDRAEFFELPAAKHKINPAQIVLLDELEGMMRT